MNAQDVMAEMDAILAGEPTQEEEESPFSEGDCLYMLWVSGAILLHCSRMRHASQGGYNPER